MPLTFSKCLSEPTSYKRDYPLRQERAQTASQVLCIRHRLLEIQLLTLRTAIELGRPPPLQLLVGPIYESSTALTLVA